MEKVIDGKRFDTKSAKKMGSFVLEHFYTVTLYQKRTGEFFLYTEHDPEKYSCSDKIEPLDYEDAKKWAYNSLSLDEFYEIFIQPFERSSEKKPLTLALCTDTIAEIRKIASINNLQPGDAVDMIVRSIKNSAQVKKYNVSYGTNSDSEDYMEATIEDINGNDVVLSGMVRECDLPNFAEILENGIKKSGVLDELTEDELEELDEFYVKLFREPYNHFLEFLSDIDEYVFEKIDSLRSELYENCTSYWAYNFLKNSIIEQAKKYGVTAEQFDFDSLVVTKEKLMASENKFYYDALKEIYAEQNH